MIIWDIFEIKDGWGYHSVNTMMKHWPGGGPEEAGRDAHFAYGKFAVYPGNNFDEHLVPFVDGALKLQGKTKMAAAAMPYYTISYGRDIKNKEDKGNSYSKYLITDLLRTKYNFDGVVLRSLLNHQKGLNTAQNHLILTKMDYDQRFRLRHIWKNIDNAAADQLIDSLQYNEMGQLTAKYLGKGNFGPSSTLLTQIVN